MLLGCLQRSVPLVLGHAVLLYQLIVLPPFSVPLLSFLFPCTPKLFRQPSFVFELFLKRVRLP